MEPWKIITQLLGLQSVTFNSVKLFRKSLTAVFHAQYKCDEYFCAKCCKPLEGIHDWQLRQLVGPPSGPFIKVHIHLKVPRGYCPEHGASLAYVPFIHPKFKSMTCGLVETAGRLMEEVSCAAAGRLLHQNAKKLWSCDQYRMKFLMTRFRLPEDLDLSYLSADEVHHRTCRNRQGLVRKRDIKFVTNLVSHKDGKVIFNAKGRDQAALEACLSVLSPGQRMAVEHFAVDMHDPFIAAAKAKCPNAEVSVDRFHLVQQVNNRFDQVRKSEFKLARERRDVFTEGMLSPARRFVLVDRKKELTKHEFKMLNRLRDINTNISNAMFLVENFHVILDRRTIPGFRKGLCEWYLLVRESKLKPFLELCSTIRKYRRNIEAYIKSRLTTAVSEGLNNAIKTLKKAAYGIPRVDSFRLKILQRHGYLNHYNINTDDLLFSIPNP